MKPYIRDNSTINSNEALDPIVENYVNVVVLPTYKDLKEKNSTLYDAVVALANNPSNSAFETACNAWITAREPWEESEAFLFGPVDELGLDPNMDSWPLDQNAIVQILNSRNGAIWNGARVMMMQKLNLPKMYADSILWNSCFSRMASLVQLNKNYL